MGSDGVGKIRWPPGEEEPGKNMFWPTGTEDDS